MYLEAILIAPKAGAAMERLTSVEAVAGRGLKGDRYFHRRGTFNRQPFPQHVREVSIVSSEALAICNARLGCMLDHSDLRRNLIIGGGDIGMLKGRDFKIGEATFRIVRTCPPCRYLSRLTGVDIMQGLKYLGGYRVAIVKSGKISMGDRIVF